VDQKLVDWLLEGDVAIQYQTYRDLLGEHRSDLQARIATEGWGAEFLSRRNPHGHWGRAFYSPKWTSSHYTLLDLRHLELPPGNKQVLETIDLILENHVSPDGGVNPAKTRTDSDVCINGMFLYYACFFGVGQDRLKGIIDFIISQQLPDGGFNCQFNQSGAEHSSLHSTLSIMEGLWQFEVAGNTYRLAELNRMRDQSLEFILVHRLFRSHRTGEVISSRMTRLPFPPRWFFDILRALDHFRTAEISYDPRMEDALQLLEKKRRKDGHWPLHAHYSGQIHFDMEKPGGASRWNTLRALRVMKHFGRLV
jgi:hypothetical protein